MDMIERVARAVHEQSEPWDAFDIDRVVWMNIARAAIAAMRECTPAMLDAGSAAHPAGGYVRGTTLNDIIECEWWAMIDAVLEETKSTTKGE
jgi:hypothetical protein